MGMNKNGTEFTTDAMNQTIMVWFWMVLEAGPHLFPLVDPLIQNPP